MYLAQRRGERREYPIKTISRQDAKAPRKNFPRAEYAENIKLYVAEGAENKGTTNSFPVRAGFRS
jgi:hypothetical protein